MQTIAISYSKVHNDMHKYFALTKVDDYWMGIPIGNLEGWNYWLSPVIFIFWTKDTEILEDLWSQIRKNRCCLGVALLLLAEFESRGLAYF